MSPNYDPARHETVDAPDWSRARARAALDDIVVDTIDAYRPGDGWPRHPRDGGEPNQSQYTGTAGVAVGLARILEFTGDDPPDWWPDLVELIGDPAGHRIDHPSLLMGRTGRSIAIYRLEPTAAHADRVLEAVEANRDSRQHELMWGLAGTICAALWMSEQTGDDRFGEAAGRQARILWDDFEPVDDGARLWLQELYGDRRYLLGAAHGQAGNLHALWSVARARPETLDRTTLLESTVELLDATADRGPDGTNWPPAYLGDSELLQWCHGAPGVVTALSAVPAGADEDLDELLVDAARLIWRAGPLTKGHNLCHGTAGNGWALLKTWGRTGRPIWLDRARQFAMAAIEQYTRLYDQYDRGWHSLWTGDIGLGIYLCACIDQTTDWVGWETF